MELTAKVTGGALAAAAVRRRRLGRSLGIRVQGLGFRVLGFRV